MQVINRRENSYGNLLKTRQLILDEMQSQSLMLSLGLRSRVAISGRKEMPNEIHIEFHANARTDLTQPKYKVKLSNVSKTMASGDKGSRLLKARLNMRLRHLSRGTAQSTASLFVRVTSIPYEYRSSKKHGRTGPRPMLPCLDSMHDTVETCQVRVARLHGQV